MTVSDLLNAIKDLPGDLPVFFRRVAPVAGNIEEAGFANLDKFASFGVTFPCVIIEPMKDEPEVEVARDERKGKPPLTAEAAEILAACFPKPHEN